MPHVTHRVTHRVMGRVTHHAMHHAMHSVVLGSARQAMAHLAGNCLALMFERSAEDGYKCEPDIFFHRFRPYISSWVGVFEGQAP